MTSLPRSRRGVLSRKTRVALVAVVASFGLVLPAVAPAGTPLAVEASAAEKVKQLAVDAGFDFWVEPISISTHDRSGNFDVKIIDHLSLDPFASQRGYPDPKFSVETPAGWGDAISVREYYGHFGYYKLPSDVAAGSYAIQVTATLDSGRKVTHTVPVIVSDKDSDPDFSESPDTAAYTWQTDIRGAESRTAELSWSGLRAGATSGARAVLGRGAPSGATVNSKTGSVTYTLPEGQEFADIPVDVTFQDGRKDTFIARFTRASAGNQYVVECETSKATAGVPSHSFLSFHRGSSSSAFPPFTVKRELDQSSVSGGAVSSFDVEVRGESIPLYRAVPDSGARSLSYDVKLTFNDGKSKVVRCKHDIFSQGELIELGWETAFGLVPGQTAVSEVIVAGQASNVLGADVIADLPKLVDHYELGDDQPPASLGVAELNPETGAVTFTPSEKATGEIVVPVKIHFKDGSVNEDAMALFQVGSIAEFVGPLRQRKEDSDFSLGDNIVRFSEFDRESNEDGRDSFFIPGTKVEPTGGDWSLLSPKRINSVSWKLTVPSDVADETTYTLDAVATFPDGSTKKITRVYTVNRDGEPDVKRFDSIGFSYGLVDVATNENTAIAQAGMLGELVSFEQITRMYHFSNFYKFRITDTKGHDVSVDEKTGRVTLKLKPSDANSTIRIPVEISIPWLSDGEYEPFRTEAVFKVGEVPEDAGGDDGDPVKKSDAETYTAVGGKATVVAGKEATAAVMVEDLPDGTVFTVAKDSPVSEGVLVDKSTGVVTFKPAGDVAAGKYTVKVTVTYPDGSTDTADVVFTVEKPDADVYEAVGGAASVVAGETSTATVAVAEKPKGTTFTLAVDSPVSEGVSVDKSTGVVSFKPGKDVAAGKYTVKVTVTYPDGSTDTADVVFTVGKAAAPKPDGKKDNEFYKPQPAAGEATKVARGSDGAVAIVFDDPATEEIESVPAGTMFVLGDDAPEGADVDADTGAVSYKPADGQLAKTVRVPVKVTYPDETTAVVEVPFVVTVDLGVLFASAESAGSVTTVKPVSDVPTGTVFGLAPGTPKGVSVDRDTGVVTVKHVAGLKGKTIEVGVVLTNGEQEEIRRISVTVPAGGTKPADKAEPGGTKSGGQSKDGSSGGAGSAVIAIIPILLAILGIGGAAVMGMIPGVPAMKMPAMKFPGM
ncbi:Rib/alpha-like domain-containing protein [Corynebacterium mendelii]|uniref:YPDG domain-containing protein n=1 Tax=Corynebacterium mendelii TaxID=2765362 RepID=A0A939E1H8_9CORY|nr:Rib/alpha-like domain-containing protein [Corynebacterium mendelii]MBN9645249.1 YPDG domain-containing protein [Corynebacterium mendelii]